MLNKRTDDGHGRRTTGGSYPLPHSPIASGPCIPDTQPSNPAALSLREVSAMGPPRKSGGSRDNALFNFSCLSTAVLVGYLAYAVYNMHGVMNPLRYVTIVPGMATVKPVWAEGTKMTAYCYLAASKKFYLDYLDPSHPKAARYPLVASAEELTFDQAMTRHSFNLNISSMLAGMGDATPNITMLESEDWRVLMSNRTLYFHVLLNAEVPPGRQAEEPLWMLLGSVPLVKYGPRPKVRPLRNLLTGNSSAAWGGDYAEKSAGVQSEGRDGAAPKSSATVRNTGGDFMSFWKPEVAVRIVADFTEYPNDFVPQTIQRATEIVGMDSNGRWIESGRGWSSLAYKPIVHVDEIGLTSDKYIPLNETLSSLPLKITIEPMSIQRWQLMQVMEETLQHQKESMGFQDSDIDDLRRLISDTNVYLLAVTLVASTLHLLFEFLAFKSDVEFWRRNKSLHGLSVRTLFMEVIFQTIILFSLIEEDASLLVTVPAGIGLLIQIWKVQRATGMQLGRRGVVFTRLSSEGSGGKGVVSKETTKVAKNEGAAKPGKTNGGSSTAASGHSEQRPTVRSGSGNGAQGRRKRKGEAASDASITSGPDIGGEVITARGARGAEAEVKVWEQATETMQYDRVAIAYLSLLLLPLVVGFSLKNLIVDEHAGWYSWGLKSLTAFVYTFGFVLMTPQLYINYKLKSVAHLPWRFLCYRFLNTIIDDLFAFVIRMPIMHRLSCFRDDVVFVIYLYQRWIYPVDENRPQDRGG